MNANTLQTRIIFRRIIQALIIVGIFLMAINTINHENDIFWQLKMGEIIWTKHYFPIIDTLASTTKGQVWTLEEWLTSVIFYLIFSYLGAAGLILFKAIVLSLTFLIFVFLFNKLKVNLYFSLIFLVLTIMVNTRGIWMVFPSIIEYLLLITTLYLLESYRTSKKKIIPYILVIISIVWVQSHGSFFLLTGVVFAYLLGDLIARFIKKRFKSYEPFGGFLEPWQRMPLFVVFLISLVTPFVSPNGFWTFVYPFRISFGGFTSYVSEYQSFFNVWHGNWGDWLQSFVFILIIGLSICFLTALKRFHPGDFIIGIFFVLLALSAVRHEAVFAIVTLFIISKYSTLLFGEYRGFLKRTLLKDILVIILIVFFIVYYKTNIVPFGFSISENGYPKYEAELINNSGISGSMFNHYNYGGYLIWKMPNYPVFIDGRLEMYEGQNGLDYQAIDNGRDDYQKLLDKYNINFLIVYITDGITEKLVDDSNWKYIYNDDEYVLYVKNTVKNGDFIKKYYIPEADKQFRQVFKARINVYKVGLLNQSGLNALSKGDVLAAINFFQRAKALDQSNLQIRFNLARSYTEFTLYTMAAEEYQEILGLDKDNIYALEGLKTLKTLNSQSQKLIW